METICVETLFNFIEITPAAPAAKYIGGKRGLSGRLLALIKTMPHDCYAEPFVGMGGVFLRRRLIPKAEVINDISGDVATFFRVLQRHYVPFTEMLRWQISGRREFERLMATDPATLTDLERAARFLYLQRLAFGGKVAGRNFGVDPWSGAAFNASKIMPLLEDLHERLAGAIIENLPYADFIRRYDRPGTLFYLDPPYWGSEGDYGKDVFRRSDFAALAALLAQLKGRFILSINDTPEVRETFRAFAIEEVTVTYTISSSENQTAKELIITRCPEQGLGEYPAPL